MWLNGIHLRGSAVSLVLLAVFALACASAPREIAGDRDLDDAEQLLDEAILAAHANDAPRAFELMRRAAELGEPEAISGLASFVDGGFGTPADPVRARDLFEQALKLGSVAAKLNLGLKLVWSDTAKEQKRGIAMLQELYESPPDDQGRDTLRGTAAGGLGAAYLFGQGVEKDSRRGVDLLEESEAAGTSTAQGHYLLGRTYEGGWGGRKADPRRSHGHFLEAAEANIPAAQWKVGMALLEGRGTARDEAAAYAWIRRSAEAGDPRGENSVAVMLALGQGVEENDAEAREWYGRGVARNLAHAVQGLGFMLLTGEGGPVDRARGWAYLSLAANAGEPAARLAIERFEGDVSEADRRAGEAIVAEWITKHGLPRPIEE